MVIKWLPRGCQSTCDGLWCRGCRGGGGGGGGGSQSGASLQWRHNGRSGASKHQPHDCLLNRLLRRRSKKTSKFRVTGLCAGNSPVTGEFPAQTASNAENVSIWWRHHVIFLFLGVCTFKMTVILLQITLLPNWKHWCMHVLCVIPITAVFTLYIGTFYGHFNTFDATLFLLCFVKNYENTAKMINMSYVGNMRCTW